jgi:hypothetical protein
MQLILELDIPQLPQPIQHTHKILLIGSCFTENISERLITNKFKVLSNPHGILFNPLSVAYSINSYLNNKEYTKNDLFQLNELWNSWDHHTRFSHTDADTALHGINQSQGESSSFIREADWVVITLGSAFQYYLTENNKPVANNHRAPAQWFEKKLLEIEDIKEALSETLNRLYAVNPGIQVLFTISPVRHIRDGVVDNNRSKARLIEVVHNLCATYAQAHYFPAYELIIDILRDYRYYDIDFVHPNYLATSFVWEQFIKACIAEPARHSMKLVQDIATARSHRTRFPDTEAHRKFKSSYLQKIKDLKQQFPFLNMEEELKYFSE